MLIIISPRPLVQQLPD